MTNNMENSFFIFSSAENSITIERFHTCIWEFKNNTSLVEFGCELPGNSLPPDQMTLSFFIPWFTEDSETRNLYDKLSQPENSRFIFNDSIHSTHSLDGGVNELGVIHHFSDRALCILPVDFKKRAEFLDVTLDLRSYREHAAKELPNVYFRFWVEPKLSHISTRKNGINRSTVIYDIKINERRNIPGNHLKYFSDKKLCKIKYCYLFNIIPNKYDIIYIDSTSIKNVRTLEYPSFQKYMGDRRVRNDELIVFFNKKEELDSYSFFSIYGKERIGAGQFAFAVLANIICGVLLFVPSYREAQDPQLSIFEVWKHLPAEVYIAIALALATASYFIWPKIAVATGNFRNWIKRKFKSK